MSTKSVRFVVTFRKSFIDIATVKENVKAFFEEFYRNKNLDCVISIGEARNIDVDPIYKAELHELDVVLEFKNCKDSFRPGDEFKVIGPVWCDASKNPMSHLWLRLGNRSDLQNKAKQSHSDVDISEIAFGTFPTMQNFMQHYHYLSMLNNKELMSTFLHNQRFFCLYACLNHRTPHCINAGKTHKFVVYYKSISRVIVNYVPNREAVELHFVLRYIPFVYSEKKGRNNEENSGGDKGQFLASDQEYQDKRWERSLTFGCKCSRSECDISKVGRCPVFKVVISRKNRAYGIIERLIQRCAANAYFFYSSMTVTLPRMTLDDFEKYPCNRESFNHIITPGRQICLQPSEHFDNRVIREFGSDHLLRVSIQDDNFSKLTFAVQYHTRKDFFMDCGARNLLNKNFIIGPRCYKFLASSNSQLREHGLWMFAKDHNGSTAESIRQWMGDFNGIRNVAKYMARMGQCFSSSEEAAQIEVRPEDVEEVADIKTPDKKYTFSDGIGMVSSELACEVRKALEQNLPFQITNVKRDEPSAFQIRFQGCKGMVAENPKLEGRKLHIRPSQNKFPCNSSNLLEIVKISAPRGLFLNRPLITILEQLGVRPNVFLKLQKEMVLDLTDSLVYERKAIKLMSNLTTLDYPYRRLLNSGICLTEEPFFRSLLLSVYKVAIDMLRSKARIAIPPQFGRNMLGVLDETRTLEYGQIFVQYSHQLGSAASETSILERTVVVTKNPCMHPGDVRKLQAIDVKALHHIKDCIVFPAKGQRPHPDEMAGSDLDGDEYVVIWMDDLVFPNENYPPMNYPANPEKMHKGPITVPDMIDFLCTYIQNDNIGVLANAHLAWADNHADGIFSKVCMNIARKYPLVLDFAKSGSTVYLRSEEKPKLYPDFMEKGTSQNSYKSNKALGMLYRVTRNLEACVSKIDVESHAETDDPHFEYSGWERYKDSSEHFLQAYNKRVKNILKKYGLQSETEALTGYAGKMNEYTENRHERENAMNIARTYILDTMKRYKIEFYKAYASECSTNNIPQSELQEIKYRRASAWYMVTYRSTDKPVLSFPWIVHDLLCEIREKKMRMQGMAPSVPKSSFINKSDESLLRRLPDYQLVLGEGCYCVLILYNVVQEWMKRSSFNLTMSAANTFCLACLDRIINIFRESDGQHNCCSFRSANECDCASSCSPTKLLLEFMKFYASEVRSNLGSCGAPVFGNNQASIACDGFRELNLQSIALRTYASLAITRDSHYLGLNDNPAAMREDNADEEGDPIRVSVSQDFEYLLTHHDDQLISQLKILSGVKDIFINADKDPRGNWFILVHSIGRGWQRWSLEELIMDENIVSVIKNQLRIK